MSKWEAGGNCGASADNSIEPFIWLTIHLQDLF